TGATASIDAPEEKPILDALNAKGWSLSDILVTHHHADHVQAIPALKRRFPQLRVTAPLKEAQRIGSADVKVREGDIVKIGMTEGKVIETPGHTAGHIVYWFEGEDLL